MSACRLTYAASKYKVNPKSCIQTVNMQIVDQMCFSFAILTDMHYVSNNAFQCAAMTGTQLVPKQQSRTISLELVLFKHI